MEVVRKNFTEALRAMKVGESLLFPLGKYASIMGVIVPRMRREMWKENAEWERIGVFDTANGTFQLKRIR